MDADQAERALLLPLHPREVGHESLPFEIRRRIRTTVPSGPPVSSMDSMSSWTSGRP